MASVEDWQRVIFSDESLVKIGADKRVHVWKMCAEGFVWRYLTPQFKVLIWACITWFDTGTISIVEAEGHCSPSEI